MDLQKPDRVQLHTAVIFQDSGIQVLLHDIVGELIIDERVARILAEPTKPFTISGAQASTPLPIGHMKRPRKPVRPN